MPKSISSVVAEDGYDEDDEMPGLESDCIPPADADDTAEQMAIWELCQANRQQQQSASPEANKDASPATEPTPSWDRAGDGAQPELSPEAMQWLKDFKIIFPPPQNSPASSEAASIRVEPIEQPPSENNIGSPTTAVVEAEQEQGPVFHLFNKLPEAVRLAIWKLNHPEPRLIEIVESKGNCHFYGKGQPVVNLQVCHESRVEALKTYSLSFSVDCEEPLIPFSFEKDALLLGRRLLDEDTHIYFRKHCDPEDLKRVQRLVVDTALCWTTAVEEVKWEEKDRESGLMRSKRDRGRGLGGLSRGVFSGVREYTALYNGDTDPLPAWANPKWYPRIPTWPFQRTNHIAWQNQYANLQDVWSLYDFGGANDFGADSNLWMEITSPWAEQARYAGVKKWDPAIRRWEMPRMSSLGVERGLVGGFYESEYAPWPFLLVNRAIEDLFE